MQDKELHLNNFFEWLGDAGCFFPVKGEDKSKWFDIESMKVALEYLVYDEQSKFYAVKVRDNACDEGFIHDPMEVLFHPSEGGAIYLYDQEESPEAVRATTLESFLEKYPNAVRLI